MCLQKAVAFIKAKTDCLFLSRILSMVLMCLHNFALQKNCSGSTIVQWLVLAPLSKKVLGSIPKW